MANDEKSQLRDRMRDQRKKLPETIQKECGKLAANQLMNSDFYRNSQRIACYISVGGEMDTQTIIYHIWKDKKQCYIPIVDPHRERNLLFGLYTTNTPLVRNTCKTWQPAIESAQLISSKELDLVILPLTAFDRRGYRLGMGGGYYDGTFAFKIDSLSNKKPWLCGFAYEFQEVESILFDSHDVRLDAIVTEKEIIIPRMC